MNSGFYILLTLLAVTPTLSFANIQPNSYESIIKRREFLNSEILRIMGEDTYIGELGQYVAEYNTAIDDFSMHSLPNSSSENSLFSLTRHKKVTLISDVHGMQDETDFLMQIMDKGKNQSDPVLVLEWLDSNLQQDVNAYLDGTIEWEELIFEISQRNDWSFKKRGYYQVLQKAKALGFRVLLPEDQTTKRTLRQRDQAVLNIVTSDTYRHPSAQYIVFYGAYHLHGSHHLKELFLQAFSNQVVTILTDDEGVAWKAYELYRNFQFSKYLRLSNNDFFVSLRNPLTSLELKYQNALAYDVDW